MALLAAPAVHPKTEKYLGTFHIGLLIGSDSSEILLFFPFLLAHKLPVNSFCSSVPEFDLLCSCKGYCGQARRRAGCGAERGTSRGSEGFSLLCNDRLNRSAYLAGDPKRKG